MSEPCGCGKAPAATHPSAHRPGQSALGDRAGTHATFLARLLAGISAVAVPASDEPGAPEVRPLAALAVRTPDDPSIAMLDAWATVADVVTFYGERIVNEGYLRTATERRSLVELARLTGYQPRPGVAAGAHLAFDLDDGYQLWLEPGIRAQSVPAPGETMQAFETGETLDARAAWNRLVPLARMPYLLLPGQRTCELYLRGIGTNLAPGDVLMVSFGSVQEWHRVVKVEPDALLDRTRVALDCRDAVVVPAIPADGPVAAPAVGLEDGMTLFQPDAVSTQAVAGVVSTAAKALGANTSKSETVRAAAQEAALALAEEAARISALGETMTAAEVEEVRNTLHELRAGFSNLSTPAHVLDDAGGQLAALAASASAGNAQAAAGDADNVPPSSAGPGGTGKSQLSSGSIAQGGLVKDSTNLQNLLGGETLELAPSRPPASARELGRSSTTALAVGSIAAPDLVSALNPRLGRALYGAWGAARVPRNKTVPESVFAFRVRTSPFGATATPERPVMDDGVVVGYQPWELAEPVAGENGEPAGGQTGFLWTVSLDAVYDRILPGSWVGLRRAGNPEIRFFRVREVETLARADYGLSTRVTRLTLDRPWHTIEVPTALVSTNQPSSPGIGVLRETTVFAQAEELPLAEEPVTDDVEGDEIPLDGLYAGLLTGRWIIVAGERTDLPGVSAAELAMISGVRHGPPEASIDGTGAIPVPGARVITFITLAQPLAYAYLRATVVIYGNVAAATHGETRAQVLGSGDGSAALQRFALQQGPLTYVAADTASGIESTLTVRVEGARWDAAPHLAALGPESRGYLVRTDHEGVTTVTFGDGVRGSRLPTGRENVTAVYRTGIGAPGNVGAGQISLLATRPQGLKGVVNPLPASGGGDPDTAEQIRRNAPLGLVSLQRVVSLEDYVDFARSFAGIGKAHAAFLADGRRRVVHLTIAGVDDAPVPEGSELHTALVAALRRYGDPHRWLMVAHRELRTLLVSARVMVRDDVLWENVEPAARAALLSAFGFGRRELGQPVAASEVVGVLQGVRGVQAVDLDLLAAIGEQELRLRPDILSWLDPKDPVPACLASRLARVGQPQKDALGRLLPSRPEPAQLLLLSPAVPDTLILTEWKR